MKLLHFEGAELSRTLRDTLPAGVELVDGDGGYDISAYPSVVVTIPANEFQTPVYGPDGELLGVQWTAYDEHEEIIRMPVSWEAVAEYVALKTPPPAPEEVPAEGESA